MFGELLRAHRRRRGLTQEELAEATGVNVRTIGKLESNHISAPRAVTVRLLADGLGLDGAGRDAFLRAAADHAEPSGLATAHWPVPAQLPSGVSGFVGRDRQLDELTAALDAATTGDCGVAPILAIGGTAGVGKTALAVHWAQRVRDRFPDGQLYVNLRGYDADRPISAADALAMFLRALGTRGDDIPMDLAERAAGYRSLLYGRRVLLLVDNASTAEQVRPLLPGSPTCVAVVTSRDSLGGLVARDGARRVELDLLTLDEAVSLLRSLIGQRAAKEPECAAHLAEQCARLPLALRVAAERAAARPQLPLSALVAELADRQHRLDLLDAGGDGRTAISAVFSWSYENLPADAARMFRIVGRHPGTEIDTHAAAAAADVAADEAGRILDRLVRAHLVHRTASDRVGMHDLLRAYSRSRSDPCEPDLHACLARLDEHYVAVATAAVALAYPGVSPGFSAPHAAIAGTGAARVWLDTELPNLVAICADANDRRSATVSIRLSKVLYQHLIWTTRLVEGEAIHRYARDAARISGDEAGEARATGFLGTVYGQCGRYDLAQQHMERSIEMARRIGDTAVEAHSMRNLMIVYWHAGSPARAIELATRTVEMGRERGEPLMVASALNNRAGFHFGQGRYAQALRDLDGATALTRLIPDPRLLIQTFATYGEVHRRLGHYEESSRYSQRALDLSREVADKVNEGVALRDLGSLAACRGDLDAADDLFQQALALLEVYHHWGEAHALARLGDVRRRQGRLDEAASLQQRAVDHFRRTRDPSSECKSLNESALTHYDRGEHEVARTKLDRALELAVSCGLRYEEAVARECLARVCAALGEPGPAQRYRRQALAIYAELGLFAADV